MESFLAIYLPAFAAILTATLLVEAINAALRRRRVRATKELLRTLGIAQSDTRRPRHKHEGGGYL